MTLDHLAQNGPQSESHQSYHLWQGQAPLLISVPHSGSLIPKKILEQMTPAAHGSMDSDWFMKELYYPIAQSLGGSLISPLYSRYVIDLNRPESDQSLYPGKTTTGLCPRHRFDGQALYHHEDHPKSDEKNRRIHMYWRPYHQALQRELDRLKSIHGSVLLWEGHSIKSIVPRFFDGRLPDLNIGTNQGQSCSQKIEEHVANYLKEQDQYTSVMNGRFKGGYITRFYGSPTHNVHAVQLELSQITYLEMEQNPQWSTDYAQAVSKVIEALILSALSAL